MKKRTNKCKTSMKTFIKARFKKTVKQTNIDKYKKASHQKLQNSISKQSFDLAKKQNT